MKLNFSTIMIYAIFRKRKKNMMKPFFFPPLCLHFFLFHGFLFLLRVWTPFKASSGKTEKATPQKNTLKHWSISYSNTEVRGSTRKLSEQRSLSSILNMAFLHEFVFLIPSQMKLPLIFLDRFIPVILEDTVGWIWTWEENIHCFQDQASHGMGQKTRSGTIYEEHFLLFLADWFCENTLLS